MQGHRQTSPLTPPTPQTKSFGTLGQLLTRERREKLCSAYTQTWLGPDAGHHPALDLDKILDGLKLVMEDKGDLYNPAHGQH